jgi:DNA-binding transcriptional MocR family regulator
MYRVNSFNVCMTSRALSKVFEQEGKALYLAIADHFSEQIEREELSPGSKLPTQRELARELGVTTGTVTRAFQELERRGQVSAEVGRGTFVRDKGDASPRHNFGQSVGRSLIDMAYNLPPQLPAAVERDLFRKGLRTLSESPALLRSMHYHFPQTDAEVLEAGRLWLARCGLGAATGEILALAGAQNALFIALLTLCKPGDEVLCEALCYPGLRSACEALHLRVTSVAMDEEGITPEAFAAACLRAPKLVYLVPTLQNPTTGTMGAERRSEILRIARSHGVAILEDDIHALLAATPERPLCADYAEGGWYLGNVDKLLAPALRCCFVRVPQRWRAEAERLVNVCQWMTPPLGLKLAVQWICSGEAWTLVEQRRAEAQQRLKLAREKLEGLGARIPEGGYHLWLPLPAPWRGDQFRLKAEEAGVAINSAEAFAPGPSLPQAVRLCLGGAPDRKVLEQGLDIIAGLLRHGAAAPRPLF